MRWIEVLGCIPCPHVPALCRTKTPIVVAIVPRTTIQSERHSKIQGIVGRRGTDLNILTQIIAVMNFQSFQSKQGIKARKEKPKNYDMTD